MDSQPPHHHTCLIVLARQTASDARHAPRRVGRLAETRVAHKIELRGVCVRRDAFVMSPDVVEDNQAEGYRVSGVTCVRTSG